MNRNWGHNYYIVGGGEMIGVNDYEQAKKRAGALAGERAEKKVKAEGASGKIKVNIDFNEEFFQIKERSEPMFVQTIVTAKADSELII